MNAEPEEEYERVKGGWISTVYGLVNLCDRHLAAYPMRFGTDSKVENKMVVCEECHPETAIPKPLRFGYDG